MKLEFSRQIFQKENQMPDSDNIHAVQAKLFHGDRQGNKDRHDEADSRFSQSLPARLITD